MNPIEEWLPIEGFIGLYAVSNHGQVMSMNYHRTGLPGILVPRQTNGYLAVQLSRDRVVYPRSIHRLVALAFLGLCPNGLQVNHIDGNKHNNFLSNLEYVSPSANKLHAFRLGLQKKVRGIDHRNAKLTDEKVLKIKQLRAEGRTHAYIAKLYGVTASCISHISSGKGWSHVVQNSEIIQ